MSAPTAHGLSPKQVQEVINRAFEAGYFKKFERAPDDRYDMGTRGRPVALKKLFQDLTGFWPSEDIVEWWADDVCPKLSGVVGRFGKPEPRDVRDLAEKCWDLFMQSVGRPVVNWEEV